MDEKSVKTIIKILYLIERSTNASVYTSLFINVCFIIECALSTSICVCHMVRYLWYTVFAYKSSTLLSCTFRFFDVQLLGNDHL